MIGVGIIGYGLMGKRYFENINKINNFKIVRILRRKKNKDIVFTNNNKLFFEDPKIDLYIVASNLNTHFYFTKNIILKNKNIIVEKPFVSNNLQADKIIEIQKIKKIKKFVVHYNDLYNLNALNLKKKLKTIGCIKKIELLYGKKQHGKIDVLIKDWLSHPLSVLINYFGLPFNFKIIKKKSNEISILFNYKNFRAIIKYSNKFKKKQKCIKFIGSKSTYVYDGYDNNLNSIKNLLKQYLIRRKINDLDLGASVTNMMTKILKALSKNIK